MADPEALTSTQQSSAISVGGSDGAIGQINEAFSLVKDYARQETVGPLRGAGRWLAYGAAGSICLAVGSVLFVLGVLRLLQNEFAPTFSGRWMSVVPYLVALVVAVAIIGVAASRIGKTSLHKD